jgi:hypothetical protein
MRARTDPGVDPLFRVLPVTIRRRARPVWKALCYWSCTCTGAPVTAGVPLRITR